MCYDLFRYATKNRVSESLGQRNAIQDLAEKITRNRFAFNSSETQHQPESDPFLSRENFSGRPNTTTLTSTPKRRLFDDRFSQNTGFRNRLQKLMPVESALHPQTSNSMDIGEFIFSQ